MLKGRAVSLGLLGGVLLILLRVSPPSLLTVTPPVYHDEYDFLSPAVAVLEHQAPAVLPFSSTPALSWAFDGDWRLVPGVNAGFHVLLALWFKALGVGIYQARVFVYLAGVAVVVLVFVLGARLWSVWVGSAAALLLVLDPNFWHVSRQVRPETFTAAAYLAGVWLMSSRHPRWRSWTAELAGMFVGLGIVSHPIGAVMLPVVLGIPVVVHRGFPPLRYLVRLAVPIVVFCAAYGAFLAWHWAGVQANLSLHRTHRLLQPLGIAARATKEWHRYGEGYVNSYRLAVGSQIRYAFVGWALLVASALAGSMGRLKKIMAPGVLVLTASPAVVIVGFAVLARDNNFLYLVNLAVWLYLAAAAGVAASASLVVRQAPRRLRATMAYGVLIVFALFGIVQYSHDIRP